MTDKVIGRATINIYPSMKGFKSSIGKELSGVEKLASKQKISSSKIIDFSNTRKEISTLGASLNKTLAPITQRFQNLGTALSSSLNKSTSALTKNMSRLALPLAFRYDASSISPLVSRLQSGFTTGMAKLRLALPTIDTGALTASVKSAMPAIGNGLATGLKGLGGVIASAGAFLGGILGANIGNAIARHDTFVNFPKIMGVRGVSESVSKHIVAEIDEALRGLPVALNDATNTFQQLYMTMDGGAESAKRAEKLTVALTKGLVGAGASSEQVSSSLEQLRQGFARGAFYMQDWKIIMANSPNLLNKVAESMLGVGHNAYELYDKLQDGTISLEEFGDAIIALEPEFDAWAKSATQSSISVGIDNMKNSISRFIEKALQLAPVRKVLDTVTEGIRGLGDVMGAFKNDDIEGIGTFAPQIADLQKSISSMDSTQASEALRGLAESMDANNIEAPIYKERLHEIADALDEGSITTEEASRQYEELNRQVEQNTLGLDKLNPRVAQFIEDMRNGNADLSAFSPAVAVATAGLSALALGFLGVASGGALAGVAIGAGLFAGAYMESESLRESINGLSETFLSLGENEAVMTPLNSAFEGFRTTLEIIGEFLTPVIEIISGFLPTLASIGATIMNVIVVSLNMMLTLLQPLWDILMIIINVALASIRVFWEWAQPYVQATLDFVSGIIEKISGFYETYISPIVSGIQEVLNGNMEWSDFVENILKPKISEAFEAIKTKAKEIWDTIKTYVADKIQKMKDTVSDKLNGIKDLFTNLPSKIKSALPSFTDIGHAIVGGIKTGIKNTIGTIGTFIGSFLGTTTKTQAKKGIESHSPSKLFAREVGLPISEGIAVGVAQGIAEIDMNVMRAVDVAPQALNYVEKKMPDGSGNTYDALARGGGQIVFNVSDNNPTAVAEIVMNRLQKIGI